VRYLTAIVITLRETRAFGVRN